MNNNIKFRLFYFDQWGGKSVIYPENDRYLIGLNGMVYENYGKSWKEPLWESVFDAAQPPIISRFTGLKDKNGKDIYEFDIVKCHRLLYPEKKRKNIDFNKLPWPEDHWYDCIEIGEIQWSDISMGFVENYERIRYDDIFPLSCGTEHRYEILGNIHENSNLLK